MKLCDYTRTVSGRCEQQAVNPTFRYVDDREACSYHDRVLFGLIQADEVQSLKDMPVIVLK